MNSTPVAGSSAAVSYGATPDDWLLLSASFMANLGPDLLPVASNPHAERAPQSTIESPGKVPSTYDAQRRYRGVVGWTNKTTSEAEIQAWQQDPDLGICIQTRVVRGLDVDVTDPALAARIQSVIAMHLGSKPCRTRANSSKFLVAFKLPGAYKKDSIVVAPGQKIEFLATGQQFVAVGTHPSGVRYEWDGGTPDEFEEVDAAVFEALWSDLKRQFAVESGPAARAAAGGTPVDDLDRECVLASVTQQTLDELAEAIGYVDLDSHDEWIANGEALACFKGTKHEDWARELWLTASEHASAKFADGKKDPLSTWAGFTAERTDFRAVFAKAQRAGWVNPRKAVLESERERSERIAREGAHTTPTQRVMTGTEMLEELVYIADGARVAFLQEPRFALPLPEFKHFTAGSVEAVKGSTGRTTKTPRAQLWLAHPDRKTVRVQTFAPGRDRICQSPDGEVALNLWVPRSQPTPDNWRELSQPFFDHVEYLVPEVAERERFLHWLGHIEQRPGELPHTHYLLVAKQTGIGRNWLAYALARVFAGYVALGFDLGESLRSGFNGALSQRLLAVVDELHEGGPSGANSPRAERLKSMLTEATRRVNPKYGRQHVEYNCCRFLMFSNHEAALPLAENDRRVVVIENPSQRRGTEYYARLYQLLDHPGLGAAIAEALRQRDIAGFNPGEVAPMSEAKRRTIRAGRTEIEQAVRDLAAEWPSDCITSTRLHLAVTETLGAKVASTQGACVAAGIVKLAGRVRVTGVPSHVWALRNASRWANATPAEIAAEAARGMEAADDRDAARALAGDLG